MILPLLILIDAEKDFSLYNLETFLNAGSFTEIEFGKLPISPFLEIGVMSSETELYPFLDKIAHEVLFPLPDSLTMT